MNLPRGAASPAHLILFRPLAPRRPLHSPTPVGILTVHDAAGPKANLALSGPEQNARPPRAGRGPSRRPTPQGKGKSECRFGTFQRRLVTQLAHARAQTWQQSHEVLQMELACQNPTLQCTLGERPLAIWEAQSQCGEGRMRPAPLAALLDLHLSLRCSRRGNHDPTIDFEGHNNEIGSTLRNTVTLVHHPQRRIWFLEHPPIDVWPIILAHFTL